MSQRGVAFATAPRRHHDVLAATSLRRLHENPSSEAFVDPPDGFHDTPGTPSNREGNFHRQRLVWRVNPKCYFLLLRRPPKKTIFGFGRRKTALFRSAYKKKKRLKIFWGGRKSYLAAEHHNEAAPKKKKIRCFSARAPKKNKQTIRSVGAEKYDFRPPKGAKA